MVTKHRLYFVNANNLIFLKDNSVDLIVTSPPYPMIKMWDNIFFETDPHIKQAVENNKTESPFKAKMLSAILPGSGQIYAGQTIQGLRAFLLNMTFGYFAYKSITKKRYLDVLFLLHLSVF